MRLVDGDPTLARGDRETKAAADNAGASALWVPVDRGRNILSTALLTAGIVLLLDIGLTLLWQEPLSTVVGSIKQGQARGKLDSLDARVKERIDRSPELAPDPQKDLSEAEVREIVRRRADTFESEYLVAGGAIGQLAIPLIDEETVMIEGTDSASLITGPGHYPDTSLPGQGKTIALAGHRTTYLAPFRSIDQLTASDRIVLEMPYGTLTYRVEKAEIVTPDHYEVVDDVGYERLVLTTCHPLYSAAERYVVYAKLDEVDLWPDQPDANKGTDGPTRPPSNEPGAGIAPVILILAVVALVGALTACAYLLRRRRTEEDGNERDSAGERPPDLGAPLRPPGSPPPNDDGPPALF